MTTLESDADAREDELDSEERIRADVMASAAAASRALGGTAIPDLTGFLSAYYLNVAVEDLQENDPIDLLGIALSHRQAAHGRGPDTCAVRVYTPTVEEHGWSNGHTAVEIVADDMPFLVDSLSAALSARNRGIHLVIHPLFDVVRDDAGDLVSVRNPGAGNGAVADEVTESWIHFDIDRESDPDELAELIDGLNHVLADVRAAVEDWPPMQNRAEEVADGLAAEPIPGVSDVERAEAAAFLDWLAEGNFTFLGYRNYDLVQTADGESLQVAAGTGLGILRGGDGRQRLLSSLPEAVRERALEPTPLLLTKANSKSTVHRAAYLDYVGVKRFDDSGTVVGEHRFLGLYAASAYTQSVDNIPVLRAKVDAVTELTGFAPDSHSGKDLKLFLETYPRDELFQITVPELLGTAVAVLRMQERRKVRLFMRRDPYERFVSCLVYLPRDRYTTAVRLRIEGILRRALHASSIEYRARVSDSVLARLHFVARVPPGRRLPHPDHRLLEQEIAAAVRSWEDAFHEELIEAVGEEDGARLAARFGHSIPEAYKEAFPARTGVADVRHIDALPDNAMALNLYRPYEAGERYRRLKIYRSGAALSLSLILPVLQHMGVHVIDERPFTLVDDSGQPFRIYDLGLEFPSDEMSDSETLKSRFEETFLAVWSGRAEDDGFNALVMRAALAWQEVVILRALSRYMRQANVALSQEYMEEVLITNPEITADLVRLFAARFDPAAEAQRPDGVAALHEKIVERIDQIASLDADRVLRFLLRLIMSCARTSYFRSRDMAAPFKVSFKLLPRMIAGLPEPRPLYEIWVYSPVVEGVHLRFDTVARGGLRWSDRREDFRTEILGLVKAQSVKNTVIIPAGAKGGFFAKQLPEPTDREGFAAAGRHAYTEFISGLLDLTDNRVGSQIVPPPDVVRHDQDDPYLVVAADKGTATFSDLANSVSASYGFWLGDAFASGGSEGYDHKVMGITARGAWESVKRHFREMGIDTQTQGFTCVGIGDMSGDVFGNGMLLSEHILLVAAFDHRHIFLDPTPDPAASFAERQRLFELPRSSWDSYDRGLISAGGGVYSRKAKSIRLGDEVRKALGIIADAPAMTPADLIRAILKAKVQLLWNGGIGTYVKSSQESNSDVGDKSNDAVRVNGRDLRCQVVGEGGNLGLTQLGRIEAAQFGVRLNTDAIDNSAGVDTSDHEVNIKILLDAVVRQGDLTVKQRNALLRSMTGAVADLVLADNYSQNLVLGNARTQASSLMSVHNRYIQQLAARGEIDRDLEHLPSDDEMREREAAHRGLTSPELSVLLAYSKLTLTAQLPPRALADDPYFRPMLDAYFPRELRDQYRDRLADHPLAAEIITTSVVNGVINRGGITFVYRGHEETGADPLEVVRGLTFTRDVFALPQLWARAESMDNQIPTRAQSSVHLEARRLLDRGARWLLQTYGSAVDLTALVQRYRPVVAELGPHLSEMLRGTELTRLEAIAMGLVSEGVPDDLAHDAAALLYQFSLLDVVRIAERIQADPADIAPLYFMVSEHYEVDGFLTRISALPRDGRWKALARQALRSDLYQVLASLTAQIARSTDKGMSADERMEQWELQNTAEVSRVRQTLKEISRLERHDLASLSVALRAMRTLVAQSRA